MKALISGDNSYSWGRHLSRIIGLLTQCYLAVLKNPRRQPKAIFVWYSKEKACLKMIHDENNVLTWQTMNWSLLETYTQKSKHACLYIRNGHPGGFKLFYCYIKMDKTLKKIGKDHKRYARKGRQKYMNKFKENILNEAKRR